MNMKPEALEIARQEIEVMRTLQEEPLTREELGSKLGIPRRRLEYVIYGLRDVGFVYRVPGTHLLALD